jgi:hypothetical protein
MSDQTTILETLAEIIKVSIDNCNLSARELLLVRLAANAAVDAPAESYAYAADLAEVAGITADDIHGVLVAVAPVIGTPRTVAAVVNIEKGLGISLEAHRTIE